MRKAFAGLAAFLMLAVVVQFFLAGSGAFDTAPNDEAFKPHESLGHGILLLAVLMTVIAAALRMPGRLIGMSGLVAGLAILQPVLASIANAITDTGDTSTGGQLVFGLHAVNGLIIMAVVGLVLRQARELSRSSASTVQGAAGDDAPAAGSAAGPAQPTS